MPQATPEIASANDARTDDRIPLGSIAVVSTAVIVPVVLAAWYFHQFVLGSLSEGLAPEMIAAANQRIVLVTLGITVLGVVLSIGIVRFITSKLRKREFELIGSSQQLITSDKLAVVGQMAASVAHEVNNPLTTINILVHDLKARLPDKDERHEDFAVLLREIEKIKTLVLRFLQFARPARPEFAATDLNELLRRVIELVAHQIERKGVRLTTALDRALPLFALDMSQAGQVFLNILLNAIEAVPTDGEIQAKTSYEPVARTAVVEIWNSGPSIGRNILDRVFDPFFSTSPSGTGLGLPISQMIMERHGGTLAVLPAKPEGTRAVITFPVGIDSAEADDVHSNESRSTDAKMSGY